jgi:hypothetical protein
MVFVRYDCVERRYEAVDLGDGQRDVPSIHQEILTRRGYVHSISHPTRFLYGFSGFAGLK